MPETSTRSDSTADSSSGPLQRYAEEALAVAMILGGAFLTLSYGEPATRIAGVGLIVLGIVVALADWLLE